MSVAPTLRLVLVTDVAVLERYAQEWTALLARSASNRPTQAPLWLLAWWRLFGARERRRLATVLFFDGERLVGLAPFLRRLWWHRRAIPFRRLELLGTGEREEDEIASDYVGVIGERGYEAAVADALVDGLHSGALGPWDELVLSAMDGEVPIGDLLSAALSRRGLLLDQQAMVPSPYIRLPATWEAYLAALPGSGRYLVNRSVRDFDKWAGADAKLERVTSTADLTEGKRILVLLHEERWKSAGREGVFASQIFTNFHDAVLPALLERGALELAWLRVRGEPVAVAYNIIWDNKVLFYQGGRTLDVPKGVRPGIVLHARLIRAAIEAGRSEYDFLPGSSQYKMQLATASRPVTRVRAAQAPVRDLACQALEWGLTQVREYRKARAMAAAPPAAAPTPAPASES
jgi:CelD/BcsL family acetyltransferase involved in cellulose biosynthesis